MSDISAVMADLNRLLDDSIAADGFHIRPLARARVKVAIEEALDTGLPRAFTPQVFREKCETLYERVFESFAEGARAKNRQLHE